MKLVQTTLIAGLTFFLSAGISFAADMGDLELTIRVVETDDVQEMHNELSLPGSASDAAREHAENGDGRGLTQANAVRDEHGNENQREDEAHNEEREEHEADREDHEDEVEDHNDSDEERDEAKEEESHEDEHEQDDRSGATGGNT